MTPWRVGPRVLAGPHVGEAGGEGGWQAVVPIRLLPVVALSSRSRPYRGGGGYASGSSGVFSWWGEKICFSGKCVVRGMNKKVLKNVFPERVNSKVKK